MKKALLTDGWRLFGDDVEGYVAARVPVCVHADLCRAGLIPDPLYGDNNEQLGWSMVDYYLMPKASYYSFRRLCAPAVSSVTERDGRHVVNVSTLQGSAGRVKVRARLYRLSDMVDPCDVFECECDGPECGNLEIPLEWRVTDESFVTAEIVYGERSDRSSYKRGHLPLSPTDKIKVERVGDGLRITADAYVHSIELEGEYIFSDNYFPMYEGQTVTVRLSEYKERAKASDEITVRAYTAG